MSSCGGKQKHPRQLDVESKEHLERRLHIYSEITPDKAVFSFRESVDIRFGSPQVLKDNLSSPSSGFLPGQGLPPGAMQSLPKRPILEKSNGAAATVFNPSMFHYQQALANMQLQQPAFIPTGESLHTSESIQCLPYHTCRR